MNEYAGLVETFLQTYVLGKEPVRAPLSEENSTRIDLIEGNYTHEPRQGVYVGNFLPEYMVSCQKTVNFITTDMRTSPVLVHLFYENLRRNNTFSGLFLLLH
jgi:hypothetical protein